MPIISSSPVVWLSTLSFTSPTLAVSKVFLILISRHLLIRWQVARSEPSLFTLVSSYSYIVKFCQLCQHYAEVAPHWKCEHKTNTYYKVRVGASFDLNDRFHFTYMWTRPRGTAFLLDSSKIYLCSWFPSRRSSCFLWCPYFSTWDLLDKFYSFCLTFVWYT